MKTTKKAYDYCDEGMFRVTFQAFHQPDHSLRSCERRDAASEEYLAYLDLVQNFLEATFNFGVNPLKRLRQILPNYNWKFHKMPEGEAFDTELSQIIEQSDFFWPALGWACEWYWITARQKDPDTTPLSICGCRDDAFMISWYEPLRTKLVIARHRALWALLES